MHRKARWIAWAMGIMVVLAVAVPAAAKAFRGSIEHASLLAGQSVAGTIPVEWSWNSGSRVDSSDQVNLYVGAPGAWNWVSMTPIRQGLAEFDTTQLEDGTYSFLVKVAYEPARSIVGPVVVDNTSPEVMITQPSQGQVIIDDQTPDVAIVAGKATLKASSLDNLSGVADITWLLGEEEIGVGAVAEYDFSQVPGQHTLTAIATDGAGNQGSHSMQIVALPGPSAAIDGNQLPEPPEGDPTEGLPGAPNPDDLPDAPEAPSPDDLPGLPDLPEAPNPDDLPDPTEDLPDAPEAPPAPDPGSAPNVPDVLPTP